jgi:hypothetical protein
LNAAIRWVLYINPFFFHDDNLRLDGVAGLCVWTQENSVALQEQLNVESQKSISEVSTTSFRITREMVNVILPERNNMTSSLIRNHDTLARDLSNQPVVVDTWQLMTHIIKATGCRNQLNTAANVSFHLFPIHIFRSRIRFS